MRIWGPSYGDHLSAETEAKELAREATDGRMQEADPAEERAESMTRAARLVAALVLIVALVAGGVWVRFGTTPALLTLVVAGLVAAGLVVLRNSKKAQAGH